MPCYEEPRPNNDAEINRLKKQLAFAEASLCAAIKAGDKLSNNQFFTHIDFEEAGITLEDLMSWEIEHRKLDAARWEKLKEEALAKLTEIDKRALGIKND